MTSTSADQFPSGLEGFIQRVRDVCGVGLEWPETVQQVLALTGEELGTYVCVFWRLTPDRSAMTCQGSWHALDDGGQLDEFVTFTKNIAFSIGFGLPGRVWKSQHLIELTQIDKERNFVRADVARAAALRSAIGVPVIKHESVIGVLESFDRAPGPASDDVLRCMESVAAELADACPS